VYAVYDNSEDKRIHLAYRLGESVFAGTPPLVMRDTYMSELVSRYNIGFTVGLGEPGGVRDVLCRYYSEPELRARLQANMQAAKGFFSFETYVQSFKDEYTRLLAE